MKFTIKCDEALSKVKEISPIVVLPTVVGCISYAITWLGRNILQINPLHAALFSAAATLISMLGTSLAHRKCTRNTLEHSLITHLSPLIVPAAALAMKLSSPLHILAFTGITFAAARIFCAFVPPKYYIPS